MEHVETIVHRMNVLFPLQRCDNSNALRTEVGVSRSLPLRWWISNF
jgi:hypothetical protein